MSEIFTVPRIQSDATASALTFNAPLAYIEGALNSLGQDMNTKSALIRYLVPVDSDVTAGNLVYFDTSAAVFKKAIAALNPSYGTLGQSIEAESCHVLGLILAVRTSLHSATMLCNGYWQDSSNTSVITAVLGVGATPGIYYLSSDTPGKAVIFEDYPAEDVIIPCINYHGNGKLNFTPYSATRIKLGNPVVRHLSSSTLLILNEGLGYLTINQRDYSDAALALSNYAITAITNKNKVTKSSIVSGILAGPGILTSYIGSGLWKLSLSSLIGRPVPATDFTLNGTLRVNLGPLTYTVFPLNTLTFMTMMLSIPALTSTAGISAVKVWMTTRGPGSCTYTAKLYWLPYSIPGGTTNIPVSYATASLGTSNTNENKLSYIESESVSSLIKGQGVLVAVINNSVSSAPCYVHQAGFVFESDLSDAATTVQIPGISNPVSSIDELAVMEILRRVLRYNPTYTE